MIVEMSPSSSAIDVEEVMRALEFHGTPAKPITWNGTSLLIAADSCADVDRLERLSCVERVIVTSTRFSLVGRDFQSADSIVEAGGVRIGGSTFVVMAGPCAVEDARQLARTADEVAVAGAVYLRGGAFKPRTSPYSFRGLGTLGLELLAEQRRRTGLRVVTEVMEPADVSVVAEFADMLQIGARSMQNFPLLCEVGRSGMPVLLKRGHWATVEEWLLAAEYIAAEGNHKIVLCERGIRTFETSTRFTLDLASVVVAKQLSHLPVVVDPSHAAGQSALVPPLALAAATVGADGLIIEVHPQPELALCDGCQALRPEEFRMLMDGLDRVLPTVGKVQATGSSVQPAVA